MNNWKEFEHIKTPDDWKNRLLVTIVYGQNINRRKQKAPLKRIAMICAMSCIILIICGTTALAYTLGGGDFIKMFFTQKVFTEKEQNYVDVEQLSSMASTTIGTVLDTEELRVDVMDVITGGNMASLIIKVTAKQLDSVIYQTDMPTLQNYRFNDESGGSLFENMEQGRIGYIYSDEDSSLAKNQFEIIYIYTYTDDMKQGEYSLQLSNFGYFTTGSPQFKSLYDETWNIQITINNSVDNSKTRFISKEVQKNGYQFILDSVQITPLTCSIYYSFDPEDDSEEQFKAFSEGVENTEIVLKDGTLLNSDDFDISWGSGSDGNGHYAPIYNVIISFDVPININNVVSIKAFESSYEVD